MLRIGARLGVVAALAVLALILVVIALAYFAQAVAALLQAHGFTTAAAAAITGTIGIVLALILALCGRLALRPKPAARAPAARSNGIGVDIAADRQHHARPSLLDRGRGARRGDRCGRGARAAQDDDERLQALARL
jgi:hypothetical protein